MNILVTQPNGSVPFHVYYDLMVQFPFMYIMTKQSQRLVEGGK